MATSNSINRFINIYPIKIMLDTNIPNQPPIPFEKSLLHSSAGPGTAPLQTGSFNNYPYFTMDVKFPETYILTLPYDKRIEFFFNKQFMSRILKTQSFSAYSSAAPSSVPEEEVPSNDATIKNIENEKKTYQMKKYIEFVKTIEKGTPDIDTLTVNQKNEFSIGEDKPFKLEDTAIKNIEDYIQEKTKQFENHFKILLKQAKVILSCGHTNRTKEKNFEGNKLKESLTYLLKFLESVKMDKYQNSTEFKEKLTKLQTEISKIVEIDNLCKAEKYNGTNDLLTIFGSIQNTYLIDTKKQKVVIKEVSTALNEMKKNIDDNIIKPMNSQLDSKKEEISNTMLENEIAAKTNQSNQQYENGEYNILCMLRILFSTKYPFSGNNLSSFQMVVMRNPEFNFKFTDFLPGFVKQAFQPITYTYLRINGKLYTVTQTVWVNDIYNHPEYSTLIQEFHNLMLWKEKETVKLEKDTQNKMTKFKDEYKDYFNEDDIKYITDQKKDVNDKNITRDIKTSYINLNTAIDKLIEAIKQFNSSITNGETSDVIMDNASILKSLYDDLVKLGFKPKQKFNNITDNLQKQLESIQMNEYILKNYMLPEGINLNYEKDKDVYKQRLKEKYGEYTNFVETIKNFTSPKKESTNLYLQQKIDDFLSNTDKDNIFNFIMDTNNFGSIPNKLRDRPSRDIKNFKKTFNTGISIVYDKNEPTYDIYVQVNCIGGELTDENKSAIDCLYKNDFLGNKMEYLVNESVLNQWEINTNRMFFDLEDGRIKQKIQDKLQGKQPPAAALAPSTSEEVPSEAAALPAEAVVPPDVKKGGTTRKLRANFIKTRKRYW